MSSKEGKIQEYRLKGLKIRMDFKPFFTIYLLPSGKASQLILPASSRRRILFSALDLEVLASCGRAGRLDLLRHAPPAGHLPPRDASPRCPAVFLRTALTGCCKKLQSLSNGSAESPCAAEDFLPSLTSNPPLLFTRGCAFVRGICVCAPALVGLIAAEVLKKVKKLRSEMPEGQEVAAEHFQSIFFFLPVPLRYVSAMKKFTK